MSDEIQLVHGSQAQLTAWTVLNVVPAHFGIPLLLATIFLSKTVQRHRVFISFLVVWIVAGVSSSLLVYAGKSRGPEPPKGLCLFQASLLYGYPPMTSLAALTVVLQAFFAVQESGRTDKPSPYKQVREWAMIVSPYISLLICAIATAAVGSQNPESISRNRRFFYCSVKNDSLTNFLALFAAVILLATVIFDVWTTYILYSRWALLRLKGALDLNLIIRIMSFALYIILAISLSLVSLNSPSSPVPDLVIATAPFAVIVIFGTQKDIINTWLVWLRLKKDTEDAAPPPVPVKSWSPTTSSSTSSLGEGKYYPTFKANP